VKGGHVTSPADFIALQIERYKKQKERELADLRKRIPECSVPEGSLGPWTIDRTLVEPPDMVAARGLVKGERGWTPHGTYTRLIHAERGVVMSDTLDECADLVPMLNAVKGRVLITGLGLGMAVDAALRKLTVSHVTVVEINKRIIRLVGPHLKDLHGDQVEIIHADAFDWEPPPGSRWDWAWHDIWDIIDEQIMKDFGILRTRYRRHVSASQLCWAQRLARKYGG